MKSRKLDTPLTLIVAVSLLGLMLVEHDFANPYFIALAVGAVVLLRVVIALARHVPDVDGMQLDHDIQMSLLDHDLAQSALPSERIVPAGSTVYREPNYKSQVPVIAGRQNSPDELAKFN